MAGGPTRSGVVVALDAAREAFVLKDRAILAETANKAGDGRGVAGRAGRGSDAVEADNLHSARLAALASLIAELTDVALFRCDVLGMVVECNDHFLRLNGGTEERAPLNIPGLADAVRRVIMVGRGMTRAFTLEVDGASRHYWTRLLPVVDEEGVVTGVAGAFQDWTADLAKLADAREDQARFRDFARAASDWFWEIDADGRLTAVSDRLSAVLGRPAFSLIGNTLDAIGRLEVNLKGERTLEDAVCDRKPFRDQLFLIENCDGEIVLFHLSGVPLFDPRGRYRGYRGAGMDVTRAYLVEEEARAARHRLESAMDELQRKNAALDVASAQARNALETKNEFLAAMSHELRTPLNAILGFAEAMQLQMFGPLENHYRDYAKDIRVAGEHLLGLIDDVLDVSVIESGEVNFAIEDVDVARAVEQARALLLIRAEQKHLEWKARLPADDLAVRADERRLRQILVNLLTNAVKFTPAGGQVGVDVEHDQTAGRIRIAVWDTGPGIRAEDHERAFEKFQQLAAEAYTGKPEGAGLGLHISRELARLMGGEISLMSTPGEGARFTLSLPRADGNRTLPD